MTTLPIDDSLPAILDAVRAHGRVVIEAPPGAGKTTRVPLAIAQELGSRQGEVLVLEPRRIAARMAARFVASELGEPVGQRIGYQVRFESFASPATRVLYVTEGVFVRKLLANPSLDGVDAIVLDEFHERHLQGDLALAWARSLQRGTRPDLHLVVMSATLDAAPIASFLGECPRIRVEGRRFDVTVAHLARPDDRPLDNQVASAVRSLVDDGLDGDVLVFVPGAGEIRRARETMAQLAAQAGLELVALHGNLPSAEQDRAVAPCARRKVILSTNVAESSVTIEGVVAVVDTGLARVAAHAPWSGLPTLRLVPTSRSSSVQRTGRAGRTRAGRCLRLYTEADFLRRPEHDDPEIRRVELVELVLQMRVLGVDDLSAFGWFEAPLARALESADALLRDLGALGANGALLPLGKELLRFPTHPRIARILLEGERRGVAGLAATVGALLGEREIALARRTDAGGGRGSEVMVDAAQGCDLSVAVAQFEEASRAGFDPQRLRWLGIDRRAALAVDRARRQLLGACKRSSSSAPCDPDAALRMSVLAGYPDRVARRIRDRELALVGGGTAALSAQSAAGTSEFVVAVDAEERTAGKGPRRVVRMATAIEPEWLLDLFPDDIHESCEARWDSERERVESVERLLYRTLTIDETRSRGKGTAAGARLLAEQALSRGLHVFVEKDALERLMGRTAFARTHCPEAGIPPLDEAAIEGVVREACEGLWSFEQLREARLADRVEAYVGVASMALVDEIAPERVRLPGGRWLMVHYDTGKTPWVASRLQDFFGAASGPAVARGRVSLVLHLLAPNQRAVQVTSDLEGFWQRHYPSIRKELCRRYPKHAWPEDGRTASPPPPGRLRG